MICRILLVLYYIFILETVYFKLELLTYSTHCGEVLVSASWNSLSGQSAGTSSASRDTVLTSCADDKRLLTGRPTFSRRSTTEALLFVCNAIEPHNNVHTEFKMDYNTFSAETFYSTFTIIEMTLLLISRLYPIGFSEPYWLASWPCFKGFRVRIPVRARTTSPIVEWFHSHSIYKLLVLNASAVDREKNIIIAPEDAITTIINTCVYTLAKSLNLHL